MKNKRVEGTIRDQLVALLGEHRKGQEKPKIAIRPSGAGVAARPTAASKDDAWKSGVKKLRVDVEVPRVPRAPLARVAGVTVRRTEAAIKPRTESSSSRLQPGKPARNNARTAPTFRSATVDRISTEADFKRPESWVDEGRALQVASEGSQLAIQIGVDFGTAYSKLAIRVADYTFLVDWGGLQGGPSAYLLNGELSETPEGLFVGRSPSASTVYQNLKLPFLELEGTPTEGDLVRSAAYLAWILRYARAWLYAHQQALIAGSVLVWQLNIGAPTGSWVKGNELRQRYERVGLAAWRLSQLDGAITLKSASDVVAGTKAGRHGYGLDSLEVLPEFAAQVAGYVHSPQRREGLYLLADVGAGTLDLACFRILLKETPEFPVFASRVEPLGTHYLMRARSSLAAGAGWATLGKVLPAPEFAKRVGCSAEDVSKVDRDFADLVSQSVQSVLTETRFRMDRRADEWKEGLPIFMAGGGASIQVYRDGVQMALQRMGSRDRIRNLPAPGSVQANFPVDVEAFGRMSVAFGLTYDAEVIGRLIPPDKIPLDLPPTRTRDKPSHEDLYGKR